MKAEEPRVGNLVTLPYNHDQEGIDSNAMMPITLTNKWLDRFGFEKYDQIGSNSFWNHKNLIKWNGHIGPFQDGAKMRFSEIDWKDSLGVKYVHQFQNIHFSLDGNEL